MKKMSTIFLSAFLMTSVSMPVQSQEINITDEQVIKLVDNVCDEVKKVDSVQSIFDKINSGQHPYKDKDNGELYVFAYDENVNMLAHPTASLVGKNFKGKPDAKGKKFRDEIVDGALKNQTGWVDYVYQKPGTPGLFDKKTYYKLCAAKNGTKVILTAGKYTKK